MFKVSSLASFLLLCSVATPALAETPNPKDVTISKLSYSGTGCKKDTTTVNLSPDLKAFTVVMSQYEASISDAKRLTRVSKNCDLMIDLKVPDGWSFMIFTVDYRGYVGLTAGATAELESRVRFNGIDPHSRIDGISFAEETDENYFLRHELTPKARRVSACRGTTRHLGIKSEISLQAKKGASALMSVDSIDGEVTQKYWIAWQRCK